MNAVPPVTAQDARIRSGDEWRTWRRDGNSNLRPLILSSANVRNRHRRNRLFPIQYAGFVR